MNPWLERKWSGVHNALIHFIWQEFGGALPEALIARTEEHVAVSGREGKGKNYRADVAVKLDADPADAWKTGQSPLRTNFAIQDSDLAVAEPKIVFSEEPPHRWIEILDHDGKLITVVEVLSPKNKEGQPSADYCRKRADYLAGGVSIVEIDLLRGGLHTVNVNRDFVDDPKNTPYLICVTRGCAPHQQELYECSLRERLPVIRIPLRVDDPDLPLDIQSLVDCTYETGRYWTLDYSKVKLFPRLNDDDAEWARQQLLAAELPVD